ncbi:hypothetical protein Nepgr_029549 [Nepenthes gracilis]|uniref:Uncharacterized protein n=1 Tax=Nepenthes gracilis TaxID=150966 RepID=A0AAD3Y5M8_NEPGR|nr:hypothetical protein Nepgr_029549 [Nepenthes gracilis]
MKNRKRNQKVSKGIITVKKYSTNHDPFFKQEKKRRRKEKAVDGFDDDEEIGSDESEELEDFDEDDGRGIADVREEEDDFERETTDERRLRLAKQHLDRIRSIKERKKEEEEESGGESEREREEREGERDALVAKILQQQQLEESGRLRRLIASRVQKPEIKEEPRLLVKHWQSVTAVALTSDDSNGFSASKDGSIRHWDVESGRGEKYLWPNEEVLKSHGVKDPQGRAIKHSKHILALAVSSDGRYVAAGGLDRHVHLWDARTREHIQAFPGHRGPVSCLSFRQGSTELFSGSFDRTVKIWNAEDRAYITTLFGHQSEVLTIDCLRKERALTIGRDRTMRLWKVPEESQLVFRAPASSLECCCFISDDVFFSGSDDGNIELWSTLRKKPVSIVKNAHALVSTERKETDIAKIPNGHIEDNSRKVDNPCSTAQSWVSSVAVCPNSDLAVSGAANGFLRLWAIESENRGMQSLFHLPVTGFANSLAFAKSGQFLIAGIGQEPRLGRWGRIPIARNGVYLQSFKLV